MAAGASPKVMSSARESSSLPIGDDTCSNLAEKPSKKSKRAPMMIKTKANTKSASKANLVANAPEMRLQQVIELGIFLISRFAIANR